MVRTAKRREQSRRSAHNRRVVEAELYGQLKQALPVEHTDQDIIKPDRVAFLRLATSYYRLRKFASKILNPIQDDAGVNSVSESDEASSSSSCVEEAFNACLNGFVVAIDCQDTKILYTSSNISRFVGYTQVDAVGMPFKDFVFDGDWLQLRNVLQPPLMPACFQKVHFRMNTALTPRGDRCKKMATSLIQMAMSCVKYLKFDSHNYAFLYCEPVITSQLCHRTFGYGKTIITKHEVDMKIRSAEESLAHFLKYTSGAKSLIGMSFYQLIHPDDLPYIQTSFKQMYQTGYCSTKYYRLVRNFEGYLWLQTDASLQKHTVRGLSTNYVLCYSQVIGVQDDKLVAKLRKGDLKNLLKSTLHRKLKARQQVSPAPNVALRRPKVLHHVYHHYYHHYHNPHAPKKPASFVHKRPLAKLVLPKIRVKQERRPISKAVCADGEPVDVKYSPISAALPPPDQSIQLKTADFLELCSEVAPVKFSKDSLKVNTGLTPLIDITMTSANNLDLTRYQDILENPTSQIDDRFLATMNNPDTSSARLFKSEPEDHGTEGAKQNRVEVTEQTPTFLNATEILERKMDEFSRISVIKNDIVESVNRFLDNQ